MAYFDYSRPDTIDLSHGIKAVGDALTEAMKRRQQQKQFEDTQTLQREQEDRRHEQMVRTDNYNRATLNERTNRERVEFAARENERNAARKERARLAPTPQHAEAILDDTRTHDPVTGQETGRGKLTPGPLKNVGPEPTMRPAPEMGPELQEAVPDMLQLMPGAPPEIAALLRGKVRPQPTMGPFQTEEEYGANEDKQRSFNPEIAAYQADLRGGKERLAAAQGAKDRFDQDTARYDEEVTAFPAKQRLHQADVRRAEATRPYTMSVGPNDKGTTFDFETQRHAAANEASERFLAELPVTVDQQTRQAAQIVAGYIKSEQIKPHEAGAMLQKVIAEGGAEAGRNRRADAGNETRIDVAKIMAARPRASMMIGEGNLDMRKFEQFEKDLERIGRTYGAKVDINGLKQLDDGLAGLGSGNQALEQGIVFQVARSMQGVGPLTQQDIDALRTNIAGKLGSLESAIERFQSGHLGPQEKAVFFGAVKVRRQALAARMQNNRAQLDKHFLRAQSPYRKWVGDDHIVSSLDTMLPGTQSTFDIDAPIAPPPELGASKRKKTKVSVSGTDDPLGAILDALTPKKPAQQPVK